MLIFNKLAKFPDLERWPVNTWLNLYENIGTKLTFKKRTAAIDPLPSPSVHTTTQCKLVKMMTNLDEALVPYLCVLD